MSLSYRSVRNSALLLAALGLAACGGADEEAFSLAFVATDGAAEVDCETAMSGLGPDGAHSVGLSDLRFYVSNLQLWDADGEEVPVTLDENDFQYAGETGWVGLIDLTSNSAGDCVATAITSSEGTQRTNAAITGEAAVEDVASVTFDVGVPQALMQEVINATSAEAAPSPLDEMYWSWATGYRHIVFNMTVSDGAEDGEGYLHVGSKNCSADGELALENQDVCEYLNTPKVALDDFDLANDTVAIDLPSMMEGLDFVVPIYDSKTMEVIGEQVGAACHSSPSEPHCAPVHANLGIDMETGDADAADNAVFSVY